MIDTEGDVKLKTDVPKLTPYKEGGCLRELFCVKWKKPKRRLLLLGLIEWVKEFKYLGTTLTNQNSSLEEIKSRLRSGNA